MSLQGKNDELDRYVIEALVEIRSAGKKSITYGELADIVGAKRGYEMSPDGLSECLGRIQDYCLEEGLPSLPVIVVNARELKPSEGFIGRFRSNLNGELQKSDDQIIEEQTEKVLKCSGWRRLLQKAGLTD